MSPFSPPTPVVVIVTLLPSLLFISVLRIVDLPEGVQIIGSVPLHAPPVLVTFEIVTSYGSKSQRPPSPMGDDAPPCDPSTSIQCPEVSILPPSPPFGPPCASKVP